MSENALHCGLDESGQPTYSPTTAPPNVYGELERVQHKCAALKAEVKKLRVATDAMENTKLRKEVSQYRKALSAIVYHGESGDLTVATAHGLAWRALTEDASWSRSKVKRRRRRERISQERSDGSGGQSRRAAPEDELVETDRPVSAPHALSWWPSSEKGSA